MTSVDPLRQHPEGLSPAQVRQGLRAEKHLADTMGGMAQDGISIVGRRVGTSSQKDGRRVGKSA